MFGSLSIAVTGMAAFSNRISITSNNIANLETTGYKASTVNFADMLAQSITRTEGDNAGCGVTIQSVSELLDPGQRRSGRHRNIPGHQRLGHVRGQRPFHR